MRNSVQVEVLTDPRVFVEQARDFLDAEPLRNNVVASMAERRSRELESGTVAVDPTVDGDLWFVIRDAAGELISACMSTDGFPPYLLEMPDDAVPALVRAIGKLRPALVGVNGELGPATEFARVWAELHELDYMIAKQTRLFRLGELIMPTGVSGHLRPAVETDADLVHEWTVAFQREAADSERPPGPEVSVAKIRNGLAWLWIDEVDGVEQIVSYAGGAVPVRGIHRIGPVYTPPQFRGHGYASACVAQVSELKRADGATDVCLFTDQSNPTSNKIYQALGYVPVSDGVQIAFTSTGSHV